MIQWAGALTAAGLFAHGLLSSSPSADEEKPLDCKPVKTITVPYKGKFSLVVPHRAAANPVQALINDYISLRALAPEEVQKELPLIVSESMIDREDRHGFPGIIINSSSPIKEQYEILENAMELLLKYMDHKCPHDTYMTRNNSDQAPGFLAA